jgi:hypothetical protein
MNLTQADVEIRQHSKDSGDLLAVNQRLRLHGQNLTSESLNDKWLLDLGAVSAQSVIRTQS